MVSILGKTNVAKIKPAVATIHPAIMPRIFKERMLPIHTHQDLYGMYVWYYDNSPVHILSGNLLLLWLLPLLVISLQPFVCNSTFAIHALQSSLTNSLRHSKTKWSISRVTSREIYLLWSYLYHDKATHRARLSSLKKSECFLFFKVVFIFEFVITKDKLYFCRSISSLFVHLNFCGCLDVCSHLNCCSCPNF